MIVLVCVVSWMYGPRTIAGGFVLVPAAAASQSGSSNPVDAKTIENVYFIASKSADKIRPTRQYLLVMVVN